VRPEPFPFLDGNDHSAIDADGPTREFRGRSKDDPVASLGAADRFERGEESPAVEAGGILLEGDREVYGPEQGP